MQYTTMFLQSNEYNLLLSQKCNEITHKSLMVLAQRDNNALRLTSLWLREVNITDSIIHTLCDNPTFGYVC